MHLCVLRGLQAAYAPLLRHWLGHFEPDQFVLISSEAYFAAPEEVNNARVNDPTNLGDL